MVNWLAYSDRTYKFLIKPPPTSWFIKKAIGKEKLSGHISNVAGSVSIKHIYEIAKIKKQLDYDLETTDLEGIVKSIIAQAYGMGVMVVIDQEMPPPVRINMKI